MQKKVLFICLGNICRSPAAEGIFLDMVTKAGLQNQILVDSAGTGGWHAGDPPDPRMISHAKERGYNLSPLRARQLTTPNDFTDFDYLLTMDKANLKNARALDTKAQFHAKIQPVTSFCRQHTAEEVPDPYYGNGDGFAYVLDLLEDACAELLHHIKKELP